MARSEDTREAVQDQEGLVIDDARRQESPGDDGATHDTELPTDPDNVIVDESAPETGAGHDAPEEGTQDSGLDPRAGEVGDIEYDDVGDTTGTDPGGFLDDFDEATAGGQAGGVDGRNDASDYSGSGGGTGDVGGGVDAMGGLTTDLDGSASALPGATQQKLRDLKTAALEAAASGKTGDLDDAVADTQIIHDASYGGATEVTGGSAATPLGTNADGELVQTEGMREIAEDNEGGFLETLSDWIAGTSEKTNRGQVLDQAEKEIESNSAPAPDPRDQLEGGSLPDHYRDPSEGWGDQDEANDWMLGTGGGVTDPTDDGGSDGNAGSLSEFDHETYTGDPGGPVPGGPVVTGDELDGFDPNAPVYDEVDGM